MYFPRSPLLIGPLILRRALYVDDFLFPWIFQENYQTASGKPKRRITRGMAPHGEGSDSAGETMIAQDEKQRISTVVIVIGTLHLLSLYLYVQPSI